MLDQRGFTIRRLQAPDVHAVLKIISDCRREYGSDKRVDALLEPTDRNLFESFRNRRSAYFVATLEDEVVGGAAISRLQDAESSVCELQGMYLRQASRGLGIGRALLQRCAQTARQLRFDQCYAETISEMSRAIAFYERHGFRRLNSPLGQTGRGFTDCWLLLPLHVPTYA
jgi:putative acetyltransferase